MAKIQLRNLASADWEQVRSIYLEGVATGDATFETEAASWPDWDKNHLSASRLVAASAERVVGWAALSGFRRVPSMRELQKPVCI